MNDVCNFEDFNMKKISYSLSNIINPLHLQLRVYINTDIYEHVYAHTPVFVPIE